MVQGSSSAKKSMACNPIILSQQNYQEDLAAKSTDRQPPNKGGTTLLEQATSTAESWQERTAARNPQVVDHPVMAGQPYTNTATSTAQSWQEKTAARNPQVVDRPVMVGQPYLNTADEWAHKLLAGR